MDIITKRIKKICIAFITITILNCGPDLLKLDNCVKDLYRALIKGAPLNTNYEEQQHLDAVGSLDVALRAKFPDDRPGIEVKNLNIGVFHFYTEFCSIPSRSLKQAAQDFVAKLLCWVEAGRVIVNDCQEKVAKSLKLECLQPKMSEIREILQEVQKMLCEFEESRYDHPKTLLELFIEMDSISRHIDDLKRGFIADSAPKIYYNLNAIQIAIKLDKVARGQDRVLMSQSIRLGEDSEIQTNYYDLKRPKESKDSEVQASHDDLERLQKSKKILINGTVGLLYAVQVLDTLIKFIKHNSDAVFLIK